MAAAIDLSSDDELYLPDEQLLIMQEMKLKQEDHDNKQFDPSNNLSCHSKVTFFCEFCQVTLSSLQTKDTHVNGERHKQNVIYQERGNANCSLQVRQVANPPRMRKKVPLRLQVKLLETQQPVIGLELIEEFMPESDKEIEPYYQCRACSAQGEANCMFTHVLSVKHKQKIINFKLEGQDIDVDKLSHKKIDELAHKFDQKSRLKDYANLLRTYENDLLFPKWPQGRAPWTVEQGGDGLVPHDAHESKTKKTASIWTDLEKDRKKALKAVKCPLYNTDNIPDIKTKDDGEKMCSFLAKMMEQMSASDVLNPVPEPGSGTSRDRAIETLRLKVEMQAARYKALANSFKK